MKGCYGRSQVLQGIRVRHCPNLSLFTRTLLIDHHSRTLFQRTSSTSQQSRLRTFQLPQSKCSSPLPSRPCCLSWPLWLRQHLPLVCSLSHLIHSKLTLTSNKHPRSSQRDPQRMPFPQQHPRLPQADLRVPNLPHPNLHFQHRRRLRHRPHRRRRHGLQDPHRNQILLYEERKARRASRGVQIRSRL